MKEQWEEIPGYEGYYKISTMGRIISMNRTITHADGTIGIYKGQLRKQRLNTYGYPMLNLNRSGKRRTFTVHSLMAITFLGKTKDDGLVVDHINNDRTDNRLVNLQLVTQRINLSKDQENKTSKYTGVAWEKKGNKWKAKIVVNKKHIQLGYFDNEEDARDAYQEALLSADPESFNKSSFAHTPDA